MLLAFLDALWTTLWVDGNAGPLSSRITTWRFRRGRTWSVCCSQPLGHTLLGERPPKFGNRPVGAADQAAVFAS